MLRVVVTADPVEHLNRHTEKASRFPFVDASLHEPRCRGVPQRMRCHVGTEAGELCCTLKGGLDRFNWLAIPLDDMAPNQTSGFPTLQMCP
jgi:hypothetical protein